MPIDSPHRLKSEIIQIIQSSLNAVDPYSRVKELITKDKFIISNGRDRFDLKQFQRVFIVGIGKAVLPMAKGVLEILENDIFEGILVPKHSDLKISQEFPKNLRISEGDHPVPTKKSVFAANEIQKMLSSTRESDLVIGLISGGGSSLATSPLEPVSIGELNLLTQGLLRSGASIHELNTVRKHVDHIKGGGLLRFISPARSIHLILSDVIGDDLSVIASGPTTFDQTTYHDAINVLKKYDLWEKAPGSIKEVLQSGEIGRISETVKRGDPLLEKVENLIIGSLQIAAHAAKLKAESLGFQTEITDLGLTGEARSNGRQLVKYLKSRMKDFIGQDKPVCIIAGGETTVTVKGTGTGGRNQELALAAAIEMDKMEGVQILTLATDGEDGPTNAAGAIVDGQTIQRSIKKGLNALDFLEDNNSYNFFLQTGELIHTGPTGTNVNDLVFMFYIP